MNLHRLVRIDVHACLTLSRTPHADRSFAEVSSTAHIASSFSLVQMQVWVVTDFSPVESATRNNPESHKLSSSSDW